MEYLYDRIEALCASRGVNITQMCKDAGVPRSALSDFKAGRIKSISADKLAKISDYFRIPADFLLDRPPFDCWEMINANRKGFLSYVDISADVLKVIWGVDPKKPDETPLAAFISFVAHTITSTRPTEDGDWEIELRPSYKKEKAPAKAEALVNGDAELNEYLEELKNREECRMLFSLAKGATKEDVMRAVAIIEALRREEEGR